MKQTTGIFFATLLLGAGLWQLTAPLVQAQQMTGEAMIAQELKQIAPRATLATASKAQFLDAECAAIHQFRGSEPAIVRAALDLKAKWRDSIIQTAVRCSDKDCALIKRIYNGVTDGMNDQDKARYLETFTVYAPDCFAGGGGEGGFSNPVGNINPPSGSTAGGGGGFNPEEGKVLLCDNGMQVSVFASQVNEYVENHPGTYLGVCQPTPSTNK
ncbi:MAG: hypothetical protein M3R59_06785 [Verrucomicrobiota bacterium]|nr:hypothetical protein [Verrucomicrobiota bacterium]